MWNSVISTQHARYVCVDAGNFYLATPMDCNEYLIITTKSIPKEFIEKYKLKGKIEKDLCTARLVMECMDYHK